MTDLSNPFFHDEQQARLYLEQKRWANGRFCPYCGDTENTKPLGGKSMGEGWYHCKSCRKKFTVRVGTLYERSKVALHKWLLATHLLCASKKGMSAHQLHRMLGVTYKTAWFMAHRIREAMREDDTGPIGGEGSTVEADETYIGGKTKMADRSKKKKSVITLVQRDGKLRSTHVAKVNVKSVREVLQTQIERDTHIRTDKANYYAWTGKHFASHEAVDHGIGEYVRGDAHTNTLEGYFAILKRGLGGVYQHCSETHLKRYLGEFDFRYNTRDMTDMERTDAALRGIEGKRLTYRPMSGGFNSAINAG